MKFKLKTIEVETNSKDHARFTGLLAGITISLGVTATTLHNFPLFVLVIVPAVLTIFSWMAEGN